MTITHWSVMGRTFSDVEYAIAAYWDKHTGHRMSVSWRHRSDCEWRLRLSNQSAGDGAYGPYRNPEAAVRAAKRQRLRLERDEGVVFFAPKIHKSGPTT